MPGAKVLFTTYKLYKEAFLARSMTLSVEIV